MLKTADFKTCARIQPKRGWCFVRKLFLCVFLCLFPIFSFSATPDYIPLEYIESTNGAWIDTGIIPGNALTSIELDFQLKEYNERSWFVQIGNDLGNPGKGVAVGLYNNRWSMILPGTNWADFAPISYDRIQTTWTISGSNNTATLSGDLSYTRTSSDHFGNNLPWRNQTIRLVKYNNGYPQSFIKFYGVKIRLDNTLVFDGIPAKRKSDGAIGMYDTVTNTFFENAGTGTFTAGPVVETYTELEYLDIPANTCFNTNVYLSKDMDIEFELMPLQLSAGGSFGGARNSNLSNHPGGTGFTFFYNINNGNSYTNTLVDFFGTGNDMGRWIVGNDGLDFSASTNYVMQTNKKYKLSIINKVGTLYADNTVIDTHTYVADGTSPITVPFYINGTNDRGTVGCSGDQTVRIYGFKATDVADIVPAQRDSDGELGLYNKTTGEFLEKIGSGTLVAGPEATGETYTFLEYIESDGTQYIDTGVVPANGFGFEVDVMPLTEITTSVTSAKILGSSKLNGGWWGGVTLATYPTNAQGQLTWFKLDESSVYNTIYDPGFVAYTRCTMRNINNHFTSSTGKDYNTPYVTDSEINGNLYLFAINSESGAYTGAGVRLYSCKLYNGTAVVRNFIPAKRNSDNAIGLYDTVTNTFFENAGTGTFVAGSAVDDPVVPEQSCEYTRLEYLKSSNTQYIQDDSFQTIGTGAIEIKTKGLQTYTRFAGWDGLVALATPNARTDYFPFLYGSWDDNNPNPVNIANENALRYEFEPGLQKLYVNGVFNRQAQKNTSIYSAPFRIFIVSTGGGYNHGSTIYYCRVFDANNVLLRNYVPVKRNSDNVLGMYDTVTGTFFTNKGSGTFTAGPELAWGNNCSMTISITWGGVAEPDASGMCTYGETFTAPSTAPTAPSGLKFLGWIPR